MSIGKTFEATTLTCGSMSGASMVGSLRPRVPVYETDF